MKQQKDYHPETRISSAPPHSGYLKTDGVLSLDYIISGLQREAAQFAMMLKFALKVA
jgi:hypothetical protein